MRADALLPSLIVLFVRFAPLLAIRKQMSAPFNLPKQTSGKVILLVSLSPQCAVPLLSANVPASVNRTRSLTDLPRAFVNRLSSLLSVRLVESSDRIIELTS